MSLKRKPKTELSDEEWERVIHDTFYNIPIDETLEKIGMTRPELSNHIKKNPDRNAQFEQAKIDAVPFLENDFANPKKKLDPKEAALKSQNLHKILQARAPDKYGNKLDVKVDQTISLQSAIDSADKRLAKAMRDVTPTLIASQTEVKGDDDSK